MEGREQVRLAVRGRQGFREEYEDAGSPKRANSECEAVSGPRLCPRRARGESPAGEYRRERGDREYDRRDRHIAMMRRKRQRGKGQVYQGDGSDQHDGVGEGRQAPRSRGCVRDLFLAPASGRRVTSRRGQEHEGQRNREGLG